MESLLILLSWLAFSLSHLFLSSIPVRTKLIDKIGDNGLKGIYALVAFVTFGLLITSFVKAGTNGPIFLGSGSDTDFLLYLNYGFMLVGFIIFFCGFFNPTPMGMATGKYKAFGITRITRHPMNMGFALFGLAHLLTNRLVVDWVFYGGFVVFGYLGSVHQDKRKATQIGGELIGFINATSVIPFLAIIKGQQPFNIREISKIGIILGIIATLAGRYFHPSIDWF